jgi:hypothetical protein
MSNYVILALVPSASLWLEDHYLSKLVKYRASLVAWQPRFQQDLKLGELALLPFGSKSSHYLWWERGGYARLRAMPSRYRNFRRGRLTAKNEPTTAGIN